MSNRNFIRLMTVLEASPSFVKLIKICLPLEKLVPTSLSQLIPNASDQAIDLMIKMLTFDLQKRTTAQQASQHQHHDGPPFNPT